jgi:genome maintenance exonuclease 1
MRTFNHIKNPLPYEDLESVTTEEGRRYQTPEGNVYPSITTVLKHLSEESIQKWKKRVGEKEAEVVSRRAAERGTYVHEMIEKYLNNDPQYRNGYMPYVVQSFLTVKDVLDKHIGDIYAQEVPLYSDELGVAGRVDCVAEFDDEIAIIDFKTSKKYKKPQWIENYFMQEAFYALAWEERTSVPIDKLVTIVAVHETEDYQVFVQKREWWVPKLIDTINEYKRINNIQDNSQILL